MKFENIIKKISGTVALLIVFLIAGGFYLNLKGFISDGKGGFVLVNEVQAQTLAKLPTKDKLITNNDSLIIGKSDAPVTIYEYSSYGCNHCADFHLYTLPLLNEYINNGSVKIKFVDFPLDKGSMQASLISYCIDKGQYFEFANLLFKNQRDWGLSFNSEKKFIEYASLFGLDKSTAKKCLKDEKKQEEIISIRGEAIIKYDIKGTPVFVIEHNGVEEVLHGAPDYESLKNIIDTMLASK